MERLIRPEAMALAACDVAVATTLYCLKSGSGPERDLSAD